MAPRASPTGLRTLIVDNYDSYTFNLYQYCCPAGGHIPVVIRNNQFSWDEIRDRILPHFDCVVISPGPGRPERESDFGACGDILRYGDLPILGVCLGHQGLATVFGGKVQHAREPIHGRLSPVTYLEPVTTHDRPIGLFDQLPNPFKVVRYHSLVVSPHDIPPDLRVTAWTEDPAGDNIVQGLEHRKKPIWGVQFHPESICTEGGKQIIDNFFTLATQYLKSRGRIRTEGAMPSSIMELSVVPGSLIWQDSISTAESVVRVRKLADTWVDAQSVFAAMFSQDEVSFWLDSAKVEQNLSRFSYMGSMSTPRSFAVNYYANKRTIRITRLSKNRAATRPFSTTSECFTLDPHDTFFMWMSRTLKEHGLQKLQIQHEGSTDPLSFNFNCGMVGFFGYEMKEESLGSDTQSKTKCDGEQHFHIVDSGTTTPDASFVLADRVVVFDHIEQSMYLMGLQAESQEEQEVEEWMRDMQAHLETLGKKTPEIEAQRVLAPLNNNSANHPRTAGTPTPSIPSSISHKPSSKGKHLKLASSQQQYLADVKTSLQNIGDGETYEVCLTTRITAQIPKDAPDAFELYKHLRKRNPAPYGAFLRFGQAVALASSSPERFMRVEPDGLMSMKPIKGTLPRAARTKGETDEELRLEDERRRVALENDEKNRAENLMIVDLIRNDLNMISEPRSVCVPALMVVESYATVHQLVTTVEGKLRRGLNAVDAIMHSFPPGSMTGAPKLRTVEILETLENAPRGPYSGVLGYFSLNGAAEFSVIIRTAVCSANEISVGAGGAIVALSDPQEEFDEMLLKANSVIPSIMQVYGTGPLNVDA
ncbi:ADC synthase [Powellomyces hirtus]|nr:ADC synthase [Powellomyces hirtus]